MNISYSNSALQTTLQKMFDIKIEKKHFKRRKKTKKNYKKEKNDEHWISVERSKYMAISKATCEYGLKTGCEGLEKSVSCKLKYAILWTHQQAIALK